MTAFATVDELQDRMGVPIPVEKYPTAQSVLRAATNAIRREARRTLSLVVDETVELHPQGEAIAVRLPETPVWWIRRITLALVPGISNGIVITNYEVTQWGRVRWTLADFSSIMSAAINAPTLEVEWAPLVVVTYTHGYLTSEDALPSMPDGAAAPISFDPAVGWPLDETLKDICLDVAVRAFSNPEGIATETTGNTQTQWGDAKGVSLTGDELRALKRWRRTSHGGGSL
jgi:hypothetical protein